MVGDFKLSTSSQCIKYLMFVFNLLFVITGIILLSIGSVIHAVYFNYQHFLDNRFLSVPSLLIAIGSIIFFIAFFGCCGAVRENYCMIVTFATLMVLIFILELSGGIAGYVLRNDAAEVIEREMYSSMRKYNKSPEVFKAWDLIQQDLTCCGAVNATDWIAALDNETVTAKGWVPLSCCPKFEGAIGQVECLLDTPNRYNISCLHAITTAVKGHAVQLGGAGLGIAFVQALGIWFSVYLARSIKRNYENM